jgi:two-component system, NarL family, invasion response regulator UvrY
VIRILIADDHGIVRKGLKQIVEDSEDMVVAGEAADGQQLLDLVRGESFDVIILDLAMPGRGGLDILRELKSEKRAIKVIVLSMYPEEQYAIRCLRDGASAYLTKGSPPEELVLAIKTVAAGRKYITSSVADQLASHIDQSSLRLPHETLSDREMQVLLLIGGGKQVMEIARILSLSVKTVSTYRHRILEKTGLTSNAQIIRYALQNKLID